MSEEIDIIIDSSTDIEAKDQIVSASSDNNIDVEILEPDYDITINKKEYIITGDNLYIPKSYEESPQWLKDIIGTITDFTLNQKLTEIGALSSTLTGLIEELQVAKNTYTQSIISSADIDERINTAITTLNSSIADSDATIVDLIATKATPTEASSLALNVLTSSINDGEIKSLVSNLQNTISNATSTLANNIDIVHSEMTGEFEANATVINSIQTYVGLDEAGASNGTGLSAYLEGSNGVIGSADSKVANNVYVDGNGNARSKFEYNSTVNVGGVAYNSGFGLSNSAGTGVGSEFWINADKFKFTNNAKSGSKAPFSIDASGSTPQVTFNGIVSFSNVSNTQGSGTNLLYNSAPKIGNETKGWSIGWSNHGLSSSLNAGFDPWRPTGGASVYVVVPGNPGIGTVFDISNSRFPVVAGARYEASAYVSSHRCNSWVTLAWFDSNGNYINESAGTSNGNSSNGPLANWSRSTMFATAPSNAATAQFYVRSSVTSDNPYCFVSYAYAGVASANQTIPSNWSEGSSAGVSSSDVVSDINNGLTTTINGGKITTGSINANKISSYNITASNTTFGNSIIGTAQIADASINNAKIADASINNAKIDNLSVDTIKLANQAVTIPISVTNYNQVGFAQSYTVVAAVGFYSSGAPINLFLSAILNAGSLRSINAKVTRDSTVIYDSVTTSVGQSAGQYGNIVFNLRDTCGAGYHEYMLYLSGSTGTTYATLSTILGLEVKK